LYGDEQARQYILGEPCGFCGLTWLTEQKNWEG
jgi:hypothetical protein